MRNLDRSSPRALSTVYGHRKSRNLIRPRVIVTTIYGLHCTPNNTTTLKTRPEGNLPDFITFFDPTLCFHVRQLIPYRTTGCVSVPVQCHSRSFHHFV
ncbi:hypothetical protein HanOQP8_Chr04g0152961 [Helianthus annuus]|nr:hypothetical protein HanOQP8_Chr04g0152961 [Helianthus annuus]